MVRRGLVVWLPVVCSVDEAASLQGCCVTCQSFASGVILLIDYVGY